MVELMNVRWAAHFSPPLSTQMQALSNHGSVSMNASSSSSPSRTQQIMEKIPLNSEAGGAGGASSYIALKRADDQLLRIRSIQSDSNQVPQVVSCHSRFLKAYLDKKNDEIFDVLICGGTLGIFVATTLALKGFRVAVVERGTLQGRMQEWNISRKELDELVDIGLLTTKEVEEVINVEFNPNRCGFKGEVEVLVQDILNLGVLPICLIELVKDRFLQLGGCLFENVALSKANIYDNVVVTTLDNGKDLVSRLLIDAMGNFSPIVRQIRQNQHPDGICLVVGACARGFENNTSSDIIYSTHPVMAVSESKAQFFWEAFPAGSGPKDRTCYLFSYLNASSKNPSLEEMLDIFWDLMPGYQEIKLEDLEILRVLFGIFPTYRKSPLPATFDRVLQVGDASGIQSPVSFGGFGSMTRHLGRLTTGISEALEVDLLNKYHLSLLNPYMPNLSVAWLFQNAMSAKPDSRIDPDFINELLAVNFVSMKKLGDPVIRPFLQDVIQFVPLARTMLTIVLKRPDILPSIFNQVGISSIIDWLSHFIALGTYTTLSLVVDPLLRRWVEKLSKRNQYTWKRRFEAWKYGAGLDYTL